MIEFSAVQKSIFRENIGLSPMLIAPVIAIGVLLVALFAPILGVQATELARLVQDAESDLTALLRGLPATGTFYELLPKFLLFNVLLVTWILVSSIVTASLAESFASRRWQLPMAIAVSTSLPVTLVVKYWIANWTEPRERLQAAHPFLDQLPALAPGGLWIFAAMLVVETVLVQAFWSRYCLREAPSSWSKVSIPIFFGGAIVIFLVASLALRFGSSRLASWLGTINIIVLYVTLLYAFLAGLIYYLRTSWGLRIISSIVVYIIAVNSIDLFVILPKVHKSRIVEITPPASLAESEDKFTAWFRHRPKTADPARATPVFVVAASGGGMRATIRTVAFLEHMRLACPDFLRHTFAISGVSGGALGALLFAGQQHVVSGSPRTGCNVSQAKALRGEGSGRETGSLLDAFFATDVTPALIGPGLFTEVFQKLLPPGLLPEFDRSVSFHNVLAASWRDIVDDFVRRNGIDRPETSGCDIRDFLGKCDSNSYWQPTRNVPLLVFNATSATDGGLVPLSNIDPDYFAGLPLSRVKWSRDGKLGQFTFGLLNGASASARFPIALPAATLQDIDGTVHTLVDGGYFDNSGLLVARSIKKKIESIVARSRSGTSAEPINANVHIIYLHETEANKDLCEATGKRNLTSASERGLQNAELAHLNALVKVRDKSSIMTEQLIKELDGAAIIDFAWDLHEPPLVAVGGDGSMHSTMMRNDCDNLKEHSPLAFYYAPTTRFKFKLFLENELLEKNGYALNQLQSLLRP